MKRRGVLPHGFPGRAPGGLLVLLVGLLSLTLPPGGRQAAAQVPPTLSVSDVSVFEGNSGTATLTFVITRSSGTARSSVRCDVAGGSAQAGSDFVAVAALTVLFSAGETTKNVPVSINGDTMAEADETLRLTLSSPTEATIADGSATGTILNDDMPTLAVNDVAVTEGDSGSTTLSFVVTRSAPTGASSVTVATSDGTAVAGTDYVARPATTLAFGGADTSKVVTVTINGDTAVEADETFTLVLTAPVAATIADGQGTGTIRNDDQRVNVLSVDDVSLKEGDTGTKSLTFKVTRTGDLGGTAAVDYATADDTASAGSDYVALSRSTLSFAANQGSATVPVTIRGDLLPEVDEELSLNLSNARGATILDPSGTGTIQNDDFDELPEVAISDASVLEGDTGNKKLQFAVAITGTFSGTPSVKYVTADGTASAPRDYAAHPTSTITFAPTATSKTVTVFVEGDTLLEPDESMSVRLFGAIGAKIVDDQGIGTIKSDDATLAVNDISIQEGVLGPPFSRQFFITRSGGTHGVSSVVCTTSDGSATAGSDYVALPPTTVTFLGGETSKTVAVTLTPDNVFEPDEHFTLHLSAPVGAAITDGTGLATVVNDDPPPQAATLSVNDITVVEGSSGASSAVFTITRSGDRSGISEVVVATVGGTAKDFGSGLVGGTDFAAVAPRTIVFAPNEAAKTVSVQVTTDEFVEENEFFDLALSGASGATIADGSGRATIIDDEDFHLKVLDVSVPEGNAGVTTATFKVRRLPPGDRGGGSSVVYTVTGGSATAGSDFVVAPSGTLFFTFFPNGAPEADKTVAVTVNGDTLGEPDETITLTLSAPVNAVIDDGSGTATIVNDDTSLAIDDVSIAEGDTGAPTLTFTVTRAGGLGAASSVTVATANGSAFVGSDYAGILPTALTFAAGQTAKTVSVTILPDKDVETNETFSVTLSAATGAVVIDGVGIGTIVNDD